LNGKRVGTELIPKNFVRSSTFNGVVVTSFLFSSKLLKRTTLTSAGSLYSSLASGAKVWAKVTLSVAAATFL